MSSLEDNELVATSGRIRISKKIWISKKDKIEELTAKLIGKDRKGDQ